MQLKQFISTTIVLALSITCLHAQFTGRNPTAEGGGFDTLRKKNVNVPDTTIYNYSYFDDLDQSEPYVDTLLNNFHRYDPTRKGDYDYLHMGNKGSASTSILYQTNTKSGLDIGIDQYRPYDIKIENFKLFDLNRPLNDLAFTPSQGQDNFIVNAKFARGFSDGISLHIDYQRINQTGFYDNQATKLTSIGSALQYLSENKKYRLITSYFSNNVDEEFNGGILTDTLFGLEFYEQLTSIPVVNTQNAESRRENRNFSIHQYLDLARSGEWDLEAQHRFSLLKDSYRFSDSDIDTDAATDSLLYGDFLIEERGIRSYWKTDQIQNYIGIKLGRGDLIRVSSGLEHSYISNSYESVDNNENSLFFNAGLKTQFAEYIDIKSKLRLGLLDYAGDFDLSGALAFSTNIFQISGTFEAYRRTPSITNRYFEVNGLALWDKPELDKPFGTKISASLSIPTSKTRVQLNQSVETNLIYFTGAQAEPLQTKSGISTTSFLINQKLGLWKFKYDISFLYQIFTEDLFGLPPLSFKHKLYFEDRIFNNNMLIQLGIDHRHIQFDQGLSYSPVNARFYTTGSDFDQYNLYDIFLNFKISEFRVFLVQENMLGLFNNSFNAMLPNYTDYGSRFRLGVRWFLKD